MENSSGGNGIHTAIRLAELSKKEGKGLLELTTGLTIFPQITRSIKVRDKNAIMKDNTLLKEIKSISDEIGESGRVLLRPSGTENLVRLMIEHENPDKCKLYIEKIAKIIENSENQYQNENKEL